MNSYQNLKNLTRKRMIRRLPDQPAARGVLDVRRSPATTSRDRLSPATTSPRIAQS